MKIFIALPKSQLRKFIFLMSLSFLIYSGVHQLDRDLRDKMDFNDSTEVCGEIMKYYKTSPSRGVVKRAIKIQTETSIKPVYFEKRYLKDIANKEVMKTGLSICVRSIKRFLVNETFIIQVLLEQKPLLNKNIVIDNYFKLRTKFESYTIIISLGLFMVSFLHIKKGK